MKAPHPFVSVLLVLSGLFGFMLLVIPEPRVVPPAPYRVVCFLPSQMGEVPVTRLILHDIKAERPTADLVGSDGSYRPMSGELCFFKKEGAKK
jgi:hypothetical protein